MVRLVDEGGRTVVVLDRLEALDASGVREDVRLQLDDEVKDLALEGDASSWTLWLLAADGSVRSVRVASLGALAVGDADWDFAEAVSMAQLGIGGRVIDVEVLRDAALWRLWVVLERGTRTEVVSFVTGPDMKVGDSVAAMATGARWQPDVAAGGLRIGGPAAWFSDSGAERTLLLAARRFDGVDGEVVVRARPAPEGASAW